MESKKYNSFSLGIFPFVSKGYPTKIQTNLEAPELTASVFSVFHAMELMVPGG